MSEQALFAALAVCVSTATAEIVPAHVDPQAGTNPKSATLLQIDAITVDGDFADWPRGLEKRNLSEFYSTHTQNSRETSTQDNWFQLAWNDAENRIYFAGWVYDDVNCTQMSYWGAPTDGAWFRDMWWIYVEWNNADLQGKKAELSDLTGQHTYAVSLNDPGGSGLSANPNDAQGSELGPDGMIAEDGTTFYSEVSRNIPPHGQAPLMEARMVIRPVTNDRFGPTILQLEFSMGILNYLNADFDIQPDDIVDLGPDLNDGLGIGWDITYVDRDGWLDNLISPGATGDPGGARIGWSSSRSDNIEGKINNPFLNGTLFFSMDFFVEDSGPSTADGWELY